MTDLILMRGLPASGKSTRAREIVKDMPGAVIVSYDRVKAMMRGSLPAWYESKDPTVGTAFDRAVLGLIDGLLASGVSVISDAQHLSADSIRREVALAKKHDAGVVVVDCKAGLNELLSRNHDRPKDERVPDSYLHSQYERYPEPWPSVKELLAEPGNLLEAMRQYPGLVNVKETEPGVFSCSFTKKAFHEHDYSKYPSTARGLFLDEDGEVLMRGFDKFYNIGENEKTSLENVLEDVRYPARVEVKQNGFLGLIGVIDGRLRFYSKSGETDYSPLVERLFREALRDTDVEKLKGLMEDYNVTLACEVCDKGSDRHIISYPKSRIYFLHCVRNEQVFEIDEVADIELRAIVGGYDYEWLGNPTGHGSTPWYFQASEHMTPYYEVGDRVELEEAIAYEESQTDHEGAVVYSADHIRIDMVKLKSNHYLETKSLRSALTRILIEDGKPVPRGGLGEGRHTWTQEKADRIHRILAVADWDKLTYRREAFDEYAVDMTYVGALIASNTVDEQRKDI